MVPHMASITLKELPVELHAQLKREAAANYRSLNQEAMARIQRSFDLDDRFTTETVNRMIQEAVESGPEKPLTRADFDGARKQARTAITAKSQSA